MNRIRIGAAVVFVAAASFAVPAGADYLYDSIRAECLVDPVEAADFYSAADPVIGTVPIVTSEVGRIGSNYLVYGGFRYHAADDLRGHLYAVRLFKEVVEYENQWEFTDTGSANLLSETSCKTDGSACLFDAGQMLYERVQAGEKARTIFTGKLDGAVVQTNAAGAYTLQFQDLVELGPTGGATDLASLWEDYVALAPVAAALPSCRTTTGASGETLRTCDCPADTPSSLCDPAPADAEYTPALANPTDAQLDRMVKWLHASVRTSGTPGYRAWPLGDIYHSSAAVVEPPGFAYQDRGYPEFRAHRANRPHMIYVGANDGMIHAFYATRDFENLAKNEVERWEPGEEAWAYLPVNMLARTLLATAGGKQRFYSQDLSCRFTDVQVNPGVVSCDADARSADPDCGWRTVLICGQGWGGSWYVALDVTDPRDPKPLWEFTHLGNGNNKYGIGRTWSVPALALVVRDQKPVWLAVFGNGMNSSMVPYGLTAADAKPWYRNLNIPFAGNYSHQGQGSATDEGHIYLLNAANGELVADLHDTEQAPNPVLADGTVLDFDDDGLVDAGYVPSYKGMNRIDLSRAGEWMCNLEGFGSKGPLTGHPTAFSYKQASAPWKVALVTGAGIDSGRDPDEQSNNGNIWAVMSNLIDESKNLESRHAGKRCPLTVQEFCELDKGFNGLNDGSRKARLLGAPAFVRRQRTGDNQRPYDDLLLYTIWTAPHHNEKNQQCETTKGLGIAHLLCMDVTLTGETLQPRCEPCDGFQINKKDDNTVVYRDEAQIPSNPVSADGRVYITDPNTGIEMVEITHDENPPNANSNRPSSAVPAHLLSWREVYVDK
jgi:type IV pilus assembly protein PilY1